jgi:hypothetical protein
VLGPLTGQKHDPFMIARSVDEVVRHAGREHHQTLQAERLPVAGSP